VRKYRDTWSIEGLALHWNWHGDSDWFLKSQRLAVGGPGMRPEPCPVPFAERTDQVTMLWSTAGVTMTLLR